MCPPRRSTARPSVRRGPVNGSISNGPCVFPIASTATWFQVTSTGSVIIKAVGTKANATILSIGVDAALSRYMIEKGSVAVDGISLTINRCTTDWFEVSIIPHTWLATTLRLKKIGAAVNIETDMIGKYVERFSSARRAERAHLQSRSETVDR